jgi:hypothetical protein
MRAIGSAASTIAQLQDRLGPIVVALLPRVTGNDIMHEPRQAPVRGTFKISDAVRLIEPTLAFQQHMDATIAGAHARLECGQIGPTEAVLEGRGVELNELRGPPDLNVPRTPRRVDTLALATRLQSFRRVTF